MLAGVIQNINSKYIDSESIVSIREFISKFSAKLHIIIMAVTIIGVVYLVFGVSNTTSYWQSAFLFVVGSLLSLQSSNTQNVNSLMSNLKGVVVGSINIGLKSIQLLEDNPPHKIAEDTRTNFKFIGIAGEKFLKKTFSKNSFFRSNQEPSNIKIILMDPFSEDIQKLSAKRKDCEQVRLSIIESLMYLAELKREGYQFEVRLYPKKPPLRLMICDGYVTTMSVYTPDSTGWDNAQLIFDARESSNSLAPHFKVLFDDLWQRGISFNLCTRSESLQCLTSNKTKPQYKLAMVHGRFQPLHHEHLEYILWGITNSEQCIIGITQPDITELTPSVGAEHRTKPEGNPYSFTQRKLMVERSLEKLGISSDQYRIIEFSVDDIKSSITSLPRDSEGKLPIQFMKIFSDWELHKKAEFEKNKCEVIEIKDGDNVYSSKNITGTLVRELIQSKRNWADFVPAGANKILDEKTN
jgi:nicotinamide mononucleotide adenylyltransferase